MRLTRPVAIPCMLLEIVDERFSRNEMVVERGIDDGEAKSKVCCAQAFKYGGRNIRARHAIRCCRDWVMEDVRMYGRLGLPPVPPFCDRDVRRIEQGVGNLEAMRNGRRVQAERPIGVQLVNRLDSGALSGSGVHVLIFFFEGEGARNRLNGRPSCGEELQAFPLRWCMCDEQVVSL